MRRLLISSFTPGIKGWSNTERTEFHRQQLRHHFLSPRQLPAKRQRCLSGVRDNDVKQPKKRGVIVQKVTVHGRVVPTGSERVLCEIVGADAEEVDMLGNRRHAEGCGRCLNHGAKRRMLPHAELGAHYLEQLSHRLNVFFQCDHRHEHADLPFV